MDYATRNASYAHQPVSAGNTNDYALGYSMHESRRLEAQASFYRDLTEDVLLRAGLDRGMRVLDLGCGVGDISLLAGEIVGPTGCVLGVDQSTDSINTAERRATDAGQCSWVGFATANLATYEPQEGLTPSSGVSFSCICPSRQPRCRG